MAPANPLAPPTPWIGQAGIGLAPLPELLLRAAQREKRKRLPRRAVSLDALPVADPLARAIQCQVLEDHAEARERQRAAAAARTRETPVLERPRRVGVVDGLREIAVAVKAGRGGR